MTIDHLGLALFPNLLILRIIGRLSFPIFAYSLVEGYIYTQNRENYFKRLFVFAIVSMIPFAFLVNGFTKFSSTLYVFLYMPQIMFIGHLDIGFTFILGFISLITIDRIKADKRNIFNYIGLILILALAKILGVDYGIYGVLLIILFYIFRGKKQNLIISLFILPITMVHINHLTITTLYQCFAVLSIPIIFALKDNDVNKKVKLPKTFFYVFYPVHITILWIARCI